MPVKPIPDGYHRVTPYLVVDDAKAAIAFYVQAFGAKEKLRLETPDGKIGHAEILIGDCHVMVADEWPQWDVYGPRKYGGTATSLMIYTEACDAMFARAIAAGAKEKQPVQDQFYGDRSGTLEDPFGHKWTIATHTEDVPDDEIMRRFEKMSTQGT